MLGGVGVASAWLGAGLLAPETLAARCGALVVGAIGLGLLFSASGVASRPSLLGALHFRISHWLTRSVLPLWVIGMLFALVPCPPLLAMVVCSSQVGSLLTGALLLMLFGLGSAVSSLLLLSLVSGLFARKIYAKTPRIVPWMRRLSGVLLLVMSAEMMGLRRLF